MANVFFKRNEISREEKMSSHPKMNNHLQIFFERENEKFRATGNRENFFIFNFARKLNEIRTKTFWRVGHDIENFFANENLEITNLCLDFGKFGHIGNAKLFA